MMKNKLNKVEAKLERMLKLDELLQNEYGMTKEEILDEIPDLDDRLFYLYIRELEEKHQAPVQYGSRDGSRISPTTFRYKDPDYSFKKQFIEKFNLNIQSIQKAIDNLEQMDGDDVNKSMIKLYLLALQNNLPSDCKPFMEFDNNLDMTGIHHIETLGQAIINKTPLKISYKPFWEEEMELLVHPCFLKQYNNRWFLLAWNEKAKRIHNFPLDRIIYIQQAGGIEYPQIDIDFTQYFDDIIGVTNYDNREVEAIRLRVKKRRYDYIRTKPLHLSQTMLKDLETEDSVFIELKVKVNIELKKLLLSYGDDIEVVAPRSLRDSMKAVVSEMAANYKGGVS